MSAAAPLDIRRLEGWSRSEAEAWNALLAALPGRNDWDSWLADTAAQTLSRPAGSRPTLTVSKVVESDEQPIEHVLEGERTVLGREAECDIVLPEKVITKQHAAISVADGRYYLEDLGSAMGVFRRHKQLVPREPVELSDGDEFSIFPYAFRFRVESLWTADDDVALGTTETEVAVWKDFEALAGPGQLIFPLRVEPAGQSLYVQLDVALAADLIGGMLPNPNGGAEAAGRLHVDRALLELLLLAVVDRLGERLDGDLRVSLGGESGGGAAWPLMRGVSVSTSLLIHSKARGLRLFLPFRTVEKMRYTPTLQAVADEAVSWRCRVSVASEQYQADDLAELEAGDVLLPAQRVLLHLPGDRSGVWECAAEDDAYGSLRLEKFVGTELDLSDQAPSPETLDELPVELDVVIGEKRLTMAEIRALAEGSVIELDRASDAPVELWTNGVRAGRGELVEVDGRLGVKVTEWLRKS